MAEGERNIRSGQSQPADHVGDIAESVELERKNLCLAGVLKKRSRTVTVVPEGQPTSDLAVISPPST
jgi:hypothetical protein